MWQHLFSVLLKLCATGAQDWAALLLFPPSMCTMNCIDVFFTGLHPLGIPAVAVQSVCVHRASPCDCREQLHPCMALPMCAECTDGMGYGPEGPNLSPPLYIHGTRGTECTVKW